MASPVTSHNNVLINRIMAMSEPMFSGAAGAAVQAHTATYWSTAELQPEAEMTERFLLQNLWSEKD